MSLVLLRPCSLPLIACLMAIVLGCNSKNPPASDSSGDDRSATSDADTPLFLETQHGKSRRFAILEDNGDSCWLYLTSPDQPRPEKDCFVYSPTEPIEELNIDAIRDEGEPPILTKDLASDSALLKNPNPSDFRLVWSADGESIAVVHKGVPVAMILKDRKRGFSKALNKSSFFGEPWDQALYEGVFNARSQVKSDAPKPFEFNRDYLRRDFVLGIEVDWDTNSNGGVTRFESLNHLS